MHSLRLWCNPLLFAQILTALVGAVPKPLLEADTEALVQVNDRQQINHILALSGWVSWCIETAVPLHSAIQFNEVSNLTNPIQGMAVLPVTGFDAFKDKPSRNLLAVAEVPDLCRLSE